MLQSVEIFDLYKNSLHRVKSTWNPEILHMEGRHCRGAGHSSAIEVLIETGADMESKDTDYGRSALNGAAGQGHLDVVQLLVNAGASIDIGS